MPLPPPEVIDLAKAYAYRLEVGYTDAEAQAYIRNRFPNATAWQRQRAYYEARRGIEVGQALQHMGQDQYLREALEGKRAPAQTVGVRVQVTRHRQEGNSWDNDRVNDLYVEARWDETIHDVLARVREWFDATERTSGPAVAWSVQFVGPTLWPGATPGLEL